MIPKSIKLAGFTINVEFSDTLYKNKQRVAEAVYKDHKIIIDNNILPYDAMVQSFYHELMHFIYYVLNEDEQRQDERLIDVVAHLLYQASQSNDYYSKKEAKP